MDITEEMESLEDIDKDRVSSFSLLRYRPLLIWHCSNLIAYIEKTMLGDYFPGTMYIKLLKYDSRQQDCQVLQSRLHRLRQMPEAP